MRILKFISNLFYDKETYFGSRCSGYRCYPSFKDVGIKTSLAYWLLKSGKKCGGCSDCNGGVRLRGNLTNPEEVPEAVAKLRRLAAAANEFADFIKRNYQVV